MSPACTFLTKAETQFRMDLTVSVTRTRTAIRLVQWNIGASLQVAHNWQRILIACRLLCILTIAVLFLPALSPVRRTYTKKSTAIANNHAACQWLPLGYRQLATRHENPMAYHRKADNIRMQTNGHNKRSTQDHLTYAINQKARKRWKKRYHSH
ncbi:hypothetical protein VTP01DRAFT_8731 [Rhizomucor pusillus]|uniref:uncharacterized protein n=1 Tax=Rhizomucor pusillus TaxID=4840 RepID=UPI0037437367